MPARIHPSFITLTRRSALRTLALLLAAGPELSAQKIATDVFARDTVALEKFEVNDVRDKDYASVFSAGGTKTSTPLSETPQAISIITRYQIADQVAQTLQEVLRYAPGVRAEMYGVDNRGDYFALRGGSEGSTVLDGLRLPLTGWWGSVRNEPFAFERVEVLRGPSSVMYGQNGPGGVVNLVSKLPQATAARELQFQYGSNEHKLAALDLTGPIDAAGTFLYRVVGLVKDAGTQIDHAYEEREYFAPSVTWKPAASTTLTVFAQYQKDESDNTNAFLPFTGTTGPAPLGPISDALFIGEPEWDTYGGERLRLGYQLEQRLNAQWTLRHQLRHDDVEGHLLTMYANFWEGLLPDNRSINRTWYAADYDHRIVNTDILVEGKLTWGETEHTVLIGADGYWSRHDELSIEGAATPLDVYSPVYGTFARPTLDYGPVNRTRTRQLGLMLQDQVKFGQRWVAVGSLRYDQARNDIAGAPTSGSDDDAISSRVGLVYLAEGGWSPYVSYSESFEAVSGVDNYGRAFKPRRGEQIEAGLKWAPKDGRIAASAAAYHLVEKNRLTTDPLDPFGNSVQKGEVTVQGIELESTATVGPVSFVANYTFTDAETSASSDPADPALHHKLTSIPEHSAALWAVYAFNTPALKGLRAGFGGRYVGETWDGTDTIRTGSNTLFDAMISYDRGPWHYALNGTNVFDKQYFATALTRGDAWFGSRRKVVATVGYRW
jgi:iron complex outermembrane receptor protein